MESFIRKGRGAANNETGRFEKYKTEYDRTDENANDPGPKTVFFEDTSKTILTKNDSPDLGFSVGINPYRGCEHGCIYCYARPTHEYLGFSAGVDFETKILVKKKRGTIATKRVDVIQLRSTNHFNQRQHRLLSTRRKKFRITRDCLEILSQFKNPFGIITKNQLVTRDIDILAPLAKLNLVSVSVSVTTLDDHLSGVMEPRASRPQLRLDTIQQLSEAGIPVGVNVAPIIPGLTDHEIPDIMQAAKKAGATRAGYTVVRLPHSVKNLFQEWLDLHHPNKKNKILNRIRDMRGGKLYNSEFGSRMVGEGEFAELIRVMFQRYLKEFELNCFSTELTTEHFGRPSQQLPLLF